MPLTDTAVRTAKPSQTVQKLSDGGGLQLWIMPSGSKLWCLAYRDLSGKQKKLSFGAYLAVTLAKAREERGKAKTLLASGIDPGQHAKTEKANKAVAEANTFAALATELRLAEWKEFDIANAVWIIPAARMKMRREHRIPLPPQALAVLESLRPITGHGDLVFPGIVSVKKPISENTLNVALRRMGYGQDEMTAHGFRAAASTLLNESGKFSADAIERALAHQDKDAIRRTYARGEYWPERVKMAVWWADYLDALRDGAEVMPFKRA
ncbi:MAG: integrase arm-type DNA-binding domain-containing protein [Proteobacteria bacterium]|nr:integrase arm-type DNA-binding domain-containing protein [Pseudomonadota bacterium]